MLVPDFLKELFSAGTPASVWFRGDVSRGALRGSVRSWAEHSDELASYLLFELASGSVLYLPFSDIFLSELNVEGLLEAQEDHLLEQRIKAVTRRSTVAKLEAQESGGGRLS